VIRVFVDTNAYVAFKKGDEDIIEVIRYADAIGVSAIVLGELLAGFALGTKEQTNRRELDAFLDSPRVRVYSVGLDATAYYALIYKQLRAKGRPIPTKLYGLRPAICRKDSGSSPPTNISRKSTGC
jgi:predicted nucleic acid-binding protein